MILQSYLGEANTFLTFQVSRPGLVADTNSNMRPGTAIIEVQATLDKVGNVRRERRPGVDSNALFLEGPLAGVVGANPGREFKLPTVITPDSPCSCTWNGLEGRFYLEYNPLDSVLQQAEADFLTEIQGWFVPGSFVVKGDPWFDRFA